MGSRQNEVMIKRLLFLPLLCAVTAFGQNSPQQNKSLPRSELVLDNVDSSGKVTGVKILKSTGVREYDEAALRNFRHWRFKAGTASHVRIPFTFTTTGGSY